jgi:hypothetical protein
MLKGLPRSLWWFVLTGAIFLLQLFPYTGGFLMFLLAPFWSVVTINLGFLSIVIEVLARYVSPLWLVLPIAWFGGYLGAAFISHQQAARLDAELRGINASQHVTFQADAQALVLDGRSPHLSGGPEHLVRSYRLPVAYTPNSGSKSATHRATRILPEALCSRVRGNPSYRAAGVFISSFSEPGTGARTRWAPVKGLCSASMPEDPQLPATFVEAKREKPSGLLTPFTLTRVTIYQGGQVAAKLVAGHAEVLDWRPMPLMGCGLISARASWECFAGFWRTTVGVGGNGAYGGATIEAVAGSLGLEKAFAADRREEIEATPVPTLDTIVGRSTDLSLAVLDAVIKDPMRRITVHDVRGLAEQPALLGDRPPAMVAAVGRALANGRSTYETARVLQGILAHLPAPDFDTIGPALIAVLAAQPALDSDILSATLANRLGRLGAPAVPILERVLFANPRRPYRAALYGLCRAGADAAPLAERIASLASTGDRRTRQRDLDVAVYAALLRMGRADIVEREKEASGRFANIPSRMIARAITASSPPEVCADEFDRPKLPA